MDDASTIREAIGASRPSFTEEAHLAALAALDRLVAERDKANASRDRWRDYYTEEVASSTQTFDDLTAAEAEVAVLTARLTEADEALRELVEAFDEWNYGGTNAKMRRGRLRHEAALARARAALDAAEPGKDLGGDVNVARGAGQETQPS